jgi:hypothetical protein
MPTSQVVQDDLRYLRQLGIPFEKSELGGGRGNPIRYRYDHLIEVGVAMFALQHGMRPRKVAEFLTKNRKDLRRMYRKAFLDQPETAITQDWVKSRGKQVPYLANELFVRLHDRYSATPGKFDLLRHDEVADRRDVFGMAERFPGGETRTLVPLTKLVLQLVAWALDAPVTKPGPQ